MPSVEFGCLPTVIGSMPHTDPSEACSLVTHYLKDIPAWPQLPNRSFRENMYVQFSQGFPGVVVKEDSIYVDRSQDLNKPLEQLYAAYLENDVDKYPVSPDYAAGLHAFLALENLAPVAVRFDGWEDDDFGGSSPASTGGGKSVFKAVLYSSLIPGGGQYYLGKRKTARYFFAAEESCLPDTWLGTVRPHVKCPLLVRVLSVAQIGYFVIAQGDSLGQILPCLSVKVGGDLAVILSG